MLKKILGVVNKLIYKLKFGSSVCVNGVPSFSFHMAIYAKSGKICVGKNFSMNQGAYIAAIDGGTVTIGKNVSLNRNCICVSHDTIRIGDNCAIGPNTVIYDHDHRFGINGIEVGYKKSPVIIENNCWLGAGVTILRGTYIGEGSVIGAGCIVTGEIPPHSIVTSNRDLNIVQIRNGEGS